MLIESSKDEIEAFQNDLFDPSSKTKKVSGEDERLAIDELKDQNPLANYANSLRDNTEEQIDNWNKEDEMKED